MAAQGTIALTSAVSALITANFLGSSGRGNFATAAALIAVCATTSLLGSPTFIVRASQLRHDDHLIPTVASISFVAGLLVAGVGGTAYLFAALDDPAWWLPPVLVLALIVPATLSQVAGEQLAANLQAQHRFRELALRRAAWTSLPAIGTAAAAAVSGNWIACVAALALLPAVTLVGIQIVDVRRLRAAGVRPRFNQLHQWRQITRNPIYRSALASWILLVILFLLYRLDVLLLGLLSDSSEVGVYSMSIVAAEIAWLFVNAKSVTLLPTLVRATDSSRRELVRRALLSSLAVTTLCAAVAAAFGRPVVEFALTSEFSESYDALLLLLPGVIAFVPVKVWITHTAAAGRNASAVLLLTLTLILNLCLNLAMIPHWGALGAATASSISYVAGASALLVAWVASRLRRARS